MTLKEEFMRIKTYEDYEKRRDEFYALRNDEEATAHLIDLAKKSRSDSDAWAPIDRHHDLEYQKYVKRVIVDIRHAIENAPERESRVRF